MTHGTPSDPSLTEVFADYLRARERGESIDIEEVCRERPALATELRRLHDDWEMIRVAMHAPGRARADDPAQGSSSGPGMESLPADREGSTAGLPFGKFRILRELGRGGMGVVYEAWQTDLDRRVALKLIARELLHSEEHCTRFLTEARTAAKVRHPGVVAIYEVGVDEGQPYLAMELVKGRGSAEVLDGKLRTPREAAALVLEVAKAVAELHRNGIVHRDIKLQNILLELDGRPRLTDFGLALVGAAREQAGARRSETMAGTPGWMAPEQISRRHGEVGPHSDVYALGVLLYKLLTGQHPNAGHSVAERLIATLEREPTPPQLVRPGIPAELAAICTRCLQHAPSQRYADATDLAEDLERWLRGDSPETRLPGVYRRLVGWSRRRRALAAHLFAFVTFYALSVFDHFVIAATPFRFFLTVTLILAGWLPLIAVLDHWTRRTLHGTPRYLWLTVDWIALTWVMFAGYGVDSRLVMIYPLLVIASGFWLRIGLVAYATALAMLGYVVLIFLTYGKGGPVLATLDQHLVVLTILAVAGVLVGYQVQRTRALSDYVGRRR